MKNQHRKKSGLPRILLSFLFIVFLALIIVFIIKSQELGGIRNTIYALTGKTESADFYYENCADGSFETLGSGFVAMSSAGIYVFDSEGDETFSRIFSYDEPRLCAEGKYAVAYDLGGNSVIFLSSDGVICDIVTEQSIVSASVNSRGYLAVCTREVGYFGSVTVYNSSGTAIYKWYSGAARVLSAQVRGSSELIVLTVGSTGSSIISMSLSSEQEKARFDYDGLIIDTVLCDNNIVAVTTGELIFMSASLEENARYDFGGRYLEFYDAGGKFISIVLGDYIVGGERTLINVGTDGDELGSVSADGEIYDLDAAYSRVAVMYYDSVCVYDRSMELLGTVEGISGAEKSILMVDGTVIAAGAFSAHTYGYSLDE